jgi:hypothetical protein
VVPASWVLDVVSRESEEDPTHRSHPFTLVAMNESISDSNGLSYHSPDTSNEQRNKKRRNKEGHGESDQLDVGEIISSSTVYA